MRKYEALFILNTAGVEDSLQELVDRAAASLTEEGAKIENVQKMDKRQFARVAHKKHPSGYYVNIFFEAETEVVTRLQKKYDLNDEVFRVLISKTTATPKLANL